MVERKTLAKLITLFCPFKRVRRLLLYTSRETLLEFAMSFVDGQKIEGNYLEFGVFEGESFINAFRFAKENNLNAMRFYAFDSFQGLPEAKGIDAEVKIFKEGDFACGLKRFKDNLLKSKVDLSRVRIIPGWYKETLTEETKKSLDIKKAAVIFIDCDLYESTVPVLNFITSYLTDGTIIIFDDWLVFKGNPSRGAQRAFREWLERNPGIKISEFCRLDIRNSFIVHK